MTLNWVAGIGYIEADLGDGTSLRVFPMVDPEEFQLVRWGSLTNPFDTELMGTFATLEDAQQAGRDYVGDN